MKKAFDQTVRDLKREVNKKVLKVPGIEQKILDATSNEPWGPHGSLLADIAQATRNYHEYQMIMHVLWKRLNDTGKNWRHVYKALTVLEYLVGHGSERVIDEIREHAYQISTLSDFQYIDSSGRDQGSNVRRKSQSLVALVNDKERIQEVRQKAVANRDKFRSTYSQGGRSPYGDRYDEDRYDGRSRDSYDGRYRDSYEGRYKDEDRSGSGRDRDWGSRDDERYGRGSDSYNRDGDRYGRDSDERYGRDSCRDDDNRGRGGDDYQFGRRSRSLDRDRDRYSEEDDRYSSRNNGSRVDEPSQGDRQLERKLSGQSTPPSYEAAVKAAHDQVQDGKGVGHVAPSATKAYSPSAAKTSSPTSTSQEPNQSTAGVSVSASNKESDEFDEFDPRGSMPATAAPASGSGLDLFGNQTASDSIDSLALVPVSYTTTSEADVPANSATGTNFVPLSSASNAFGQPSEDPFGDGPFKATEQDKFQAQQQGFAHATSFQPSGTVQGAEPPAPAAPTFDFGDPLGGLTYMPAVANGHQHFGASPSHMASEFPVPQANNGARGGVPPQQFQQPAFPTNMHAPNTNYLPQPGPPAVLAPQPAAQPVGASYPQPAPVNYHTEPGLYSQPAQQTAPVNYPTQPSLSSQPAPQTALTTPGQPAMATPQKDKFETKSTVWADTLNRGLVNLNISGAKVNPLADIGVDFESINRMDRRKEKSSAAPLTSTITMGKAMGSGSGMGRAGAGGLAPLSNPMMGSGMGMGMGMGSAGGMGRGMGMGMGAGPGMGMGSYAGGMNQPMGMNMGMNPGAQMRPPAQGPGMPGGGYNPMMGTGMGGGYGSQQPYGGGYR